MRVRLVPVPGHQVAIDGDVELPVLAGNQPETLYVVSRPVQRFASHPGSSRRVSSMVTVLDFDLHLGIGHTITSLRNYLL